MGPKSSNSTKSGLKEDTLKSEDLDYIKKRERNNVAVRRSREKSRQKQKETLEKVNQLRLENQELEMRVTLLSKELSVLRDLFLEHAGVGQSSGNISQNSDDITDETNCEPDCPVNALAAKMDHEYTTKPFSQT